MVVTTEPSPSDKFGHFGNGEGPVDEIPRTSERKRRETDLEMYEE